MPHLIFLSIISWSYGVKFQPKAFSYNEVFVYSAAFLNFFLDFYCRKLIIIKERVKR